MRKLIDLIYIKLNLGYRISTRKCDRPNNYGTRTMSYLLELFKGHRQDLWRLKKVEMGKDIFHSVKCMSLWHFAGDTLKENETDHCIILVVIHLKENKSQYPHLSSPVFRYGVGCLVDIWETAQAGVLQGPLACHCHSWLCRNCRPLSVLAQVVKRACLERSIVSHLTLKWFPC